MDKPKAATKTEVYAALAGTTGLAKKQITQVMDALTDFIKSQSRRDEP